MAIPNSGDTDSVASKHPPAFFDPEIPVERTDSIWLSLDASEPCGIPSLRDFQVRDFALLNHKLEIS